MKSIIRISLLVIILMSCKDISSSDRVTVSNRQILVNNKPYIIKGICYHPVPKGVNNIRVFDNLQQDIDLMQQAGINTIRVYEPIVERWVLDSLQNANIKVIIGFGYNQNGVYDILSGSYLNYVKEFKDHNAILMWELGNEYNYHPQWFGDDIKNWYSAMDLAATEIHKLDRNHLVSTAHGDLPDSLALSTAQNIDVWGMNVYRWDNPESIFKEWEKISSKPMYLSEAGTDSFMTVEREGFEQGENQDAQAQANNKILKQVFDNTKICSGVTVFSFTDGWWKAGNPNIQDHGGFAPNSAGVPYDGIPNEEYWGIVDLDRNKKQTFDVIKQHYKGFK